MITDARIARLPEYLQCHDPPTRCCPAPLRASARIAAILNPIPVHKPPILYHIPWI